ncbi:trypsin-like peptidase domain-containing protein [Candidatus Woesebacteria bacterium]|nr:trypsin-like peptidase domain-containing protein [Candidatus Woesebacteria bacterium]
MTKINFKKFLVGLAVVIIILASVAGGAVADRLFGIKPLDLLFKRRQESVRIGSVEQKILTEESVVIDVAERVSPSVVTVSIQTPRRRILEFNPFGGFSSRFEGGQPQDIGTGFIISEDGLIVTNKHVVSESGATYKVITKDGKEHEVRQISRDPANDVAILKIDASGLKAVEMGDSKTLKVGQFVIAIGTALGEFRHTVTTGVISGLGRGISAGNPLEGFVERLDDVIQTDAAINPGNSGGPLLNSTGQVIGVNVAVAKEAQNIGFALPINLLKESLDQFKSAGRFPARAFLGVQYELISREGAILNKVPQGAYITDVVSGSPAEKAGIKVDDILTKFDGQEIKEDNGGLAEIIRKKKPGDIVKIEVWRDGETVSVSATLSEFSE